MKDLDGYIDVLSCYNQTPLRSANFLVLPWTQGLLLTSFYYYLH